MKKNILTTIVVISMSTSVFSLNCTNLGVRITNTTPYACELKGKSIFYGALAENQIPTTIQSGTATQEFFMKQDDIGIGFTLNYTCGNKNIKFYSYQDYCGIAAGEVGGYPETWNELTMQHMDRMGSYWSGLPGLISWTIQE